MKSRASQKFLANHPGQHQMFVNLVKSAKQTKCKFQWQREEDQINNEMSNMVKNQKITQFRQGDLTSDRQRKRLNLHKRVSWKKNLFEIRTITESRSDETFPGIVPVLVQQTSSRQTVSLSEKTCDEIVPDLLQQTWNKQPQGIKTVIESWSDKKFVGTVPDLLQQTTTTDISMSDEKCDSSLPDLLQTIFSKTSNCDVSVPDLLLQTSRTQSQEPSSAQSQELHFSHENLSSSSSSSICLSSTSSTPESAEDLFGSRKQEQKPLKFSFLIYCDHHQKQR